MNALYLFLSFFLLCAAAGIAEGISTWISMRRELRGLAGEIRAYNDFDGGERTHLSSTPLGRDDPPSIHPEGHEGGALRRREGRL